MDIAPFNFVDLEEKATDYLSRVKTDAVQIVAHARNEVARLRSTTFSEIADARENAQKEAETIRVRLSELNRKLKDEEERFLKRKEELENETIKLREEIALEHESSKKNGYDEGYKAGYDEGHKKGYADGEIQATVDYADKVRNEAEVQLGAKLETLLPALHSMIERLETAKQSFLLHWEQSAIQVATQIANRAISRELPDMIDVPLKLLREALELGAGSTTLKIRLNPNDYATLTPQINIIVQEMSGASDTEIISDAKIMPGGCLLETSLGLIDNQIASRLHRIEQELCNVQ
ncbi:MAG: FliH/SctL family protein [Thermoguttaceae bacterium]